MPLAGDRCFQWVQSMDVEPKNRGGKRLPPKWMVKRMENPIKMDDFGVALFLETPV